MYFFTRFNCLFATYTVFIQWKYMHLLLMVLRKTDSKIRIDA